MGQIETRKEARLAAAKARRGTTDWKAAGDALVAEREAAKQARLAEIRNAEVAGWERIQTSVDPGRLDAHRRRFEAMLAEAADDSGAERDSIALDVLDAYLLTLRPSRRTVAEALELLRTEFAFSTESGLDHLRRLG